MDLQIFSIQRNAGNVRLFVLPIHHCEADPLEGLHCCKPRYGRLGCVEERHVACGLLHELGGSAM
jgi:hypothetical protein